MRLPYLALGCHNLTAGSSALRSRRLVSTALDLGITKFDVAPAYGLGTAEAMLGRALGSHRNDPQIEITTKFGIAPPPHGALKAWGREPYRLLQAVRGRSGIRPSVATVARLHRETFGNDQIAPRTALERSLTALRTERVATFLTHEGIAPARRIEVIDSLAALRGEGLVSSIGFAGELANVVPLSRAAEGQADVLQVSVLNFAAVPTANELRGFNMSRLAGRILANETAHAMLADTLGRRDFAAALAAAFAVARVFHPGAVFLINASTPDRLAAVVEPLAAGRLDPFAALAPSALMASDASED